MAFLDRVKSLFGTGEGSWRGPFAGVGEWGGLHTIDPLGDGWQRNLTIDANSARTIPAAYAAVMANARAASQCTPMHHRKVNGRVEVITTAAPARIFRKPNAYETWPQFLTNCIGQMLFDGEAFVVFARNNRNEIDAMHLMPRRACSPYVEEGEIFYSIGSNPMLASGTEMMAPARDVMHLRQYTPRHPLMGESPIKAAALAAGVNVSLNRHQAAFFERMSRPSGILSTDAHLNSQQMQQLREAFAQQAKGWASGGMPILGSGMKFQPLSISSQDSQLIQAQRLSIEDIARVYGVPLPVIGDLTHATLSNVEQLISMWLSISLGALLDNIERSLERAFDLGPNEYIELDPTPLLRTDFIGRIDGLVKGVQGGLFTPNEARMREGLNPVANGDVPYLQQQMVELGWKPEPAPAQDLTPPEPAPEPAKPEEGDPEISKALVYSMLEYRRKVA